MNVLKDESGQTSTEYILMIGVIAIITISLMRKASDYLVGSGTCPNDSIMCTLLGTFQGPGFFQGNYRYFSLKR